MKACSAVSLFGASVVMAVFAGCGGSAEPPAAAPTSAAPAEAPAAAPAPSEDPTTQVVTPEAAPSAATPAASASDAPAPVETRTLDSIATLVKAHRKEARECYEKGLKQIPGLKG